MKIAIIGSGIAGLAAGWLLAKSGHQVVLFEKQNALGMDAHSLEISSNQVLEISSSQALQIAANQGSQAQAFAAQAPAAWTIRTDVPPRLFNPQLWPSLVWLYQAAGIEFEAADPSKSFSSARQPAYLKLSRGYRPTLATVFNPQARSIANESLRMLKQVRAAEAADDWDDSMSLKTYLQTHHFADDFIYQFLYPALASTVCTCHYQDLDEYPSRIILSALLKMIDGQGLQKTRHGTADVVQRLSASITDIRLGAEVKSVSQLPRSDVASPAPGPDRTVSDNRGTVRLELAQERLYFDHVIFATQANHVLPMLPEAGAEVRCALNGFAYQQAPVIVHSDRELMPRAEQDWAHFNIISSGDSQAAMCTVWMNRFNPTWKVSTPIFQTIMPWRRPSEDKIYAERNLQRPLVNMSSLGAWQQLDKIHQQPGRRIWFCGSYAQYGIPLLESGVASSLQIVKWIQQQSHGIEPNSEVTFPSIAIKNLARPSNR